MSEGMLTWSTLNCPFTRTGRTVRKGTSSSFTDVRLSQLAFPTLYKGFVSGASYARKLDEGAKTVRSGSLNELFSNSYTGDTGHEYYKRKIQDWHFDNSQFNNPASTHLYHTPWIAGGYQLYGYTPQWTPSTAWWMRDEDLAKESVGFLQGTLPLRSEADVLQAIIELLREGLPSALFSALLKKPSKSKRDFVKKLSSDYLSYIFGVTPVIREIDKVTKAIAGINDIIEQWQRDDGKNVVRRRSTEKEFFSNYVGHNQATTRFSGFGWTVPPGVSKGNLQFGPAVGSSAMKRITIEDSLVRSQRFGFSVAYNYNLGELINHDLPFGLSGMSGPERSLYIYASALGISPSHVNASLLWELVPFSWLVDWFCNIGQMIDVSTTLDKAGLHVLFAYLTVVEELQWTQKWTYTGTSPIYSGTGHNLVHAYSIRRTRATPFGFGTSFEGLSANQGAILAALSSKFLL